MMRRDNKKGCDAYDYDDNEYRIEGYLTYRPLSNLPTPPPSSRNSSAAQSPRTNLEDGEALNANFIGMSLYLGDDRSQSTNFLSPGPAIHLVNLIPPSASLITPSAPLVQAILTRAALPVETVALAVCILDSLDSKFARNWRLSCPLLTDYFSSSSKRHTLPSSPLPYHQQQVHIDSVNPELIILAALVIAVKFTEDPQDATRYYCRAWGRGMWSHNQLNVTERCIMENLNYRIMPLCNDECLTDAMVDMQLAAVQPSWASRAYTPPESNSGSDEDLYVPTHSRSKTLGTGKATLGLGLTLTPMDTPAAGVPRTTPRRTDHSGDYFTSVEA